MPSVFVQSLGAALYTGTITGAGWQPAYDEAGVGGLLKMALEPAGGFGKFLMVLGALSAVPLHTLALPIHPITYNLDDVANLAQKNNIPNNYSFAPHAQNFGPWALRILRIVLVTFGFVAAVIVGCCAAVYFRDMLQTFLSVIGYWTVIHITVVEMEHVFWRHGSAGYDLDAWDDPKKLPFGWAAIGSFSGGFVGAVLGMKVA